MQIKLSSGFEFELANDCIDNMELVDALADMQSDEDVMAISKVAKHLFGKHKKDIYDSYRKDGKVSMIDISNAIKETFEQLGQKGKN